MPSPWYGPTCFAHRVIAGVTAGAGIADIVNGISIDTTVVRGSEAQSLKLTCSASAAYLIKNFTTNPTHIVAVAYVNFSVLPTANTRLLNIFYSGVGEIGVGFDFTNGRFCLRTPGAGTIPQTTGPVVTTGTWYRIEMHLDVSANPWVITGKYAIGDDTSSVTDLGSATAAIAANPTGGRIELGSNASVTWTANFTDYMVSLTAADYPIGPLSVQALFPSGVGTHNLDASPSLVLFQHDGTTATALTNSETTSYQRIDEVPIGSDSARIYETGSPSGSEYAEWIFSANAVSAPLGVFVVEALRNDSGTTANSVGSKISDGVSTSDIYSGLNIGSATLIYKSASFGAAPSGAWTAALINNLRLRWGFSTNTASTPRLDGVVIEVGYAPSSTTTISKTGGGISSLISGALKTVTPRKVGGGIAPSVTGGVYKSLRIKVGGSKSTGVSGATKTTLVYQHQRPSADVSMSGWSPTPGTPTTLYDKLNEAIVDDSTYISATAT